MKLSIIVPTIRIDRWDLLFNSVKNACKLNDFELILVGPEPNLKCEAWLDGRLKYVRSFASPNTCQQIGLINVAGNSDFVTHFADDCVFEPDVLDKCLKSLYGQDEKTALIIKYSEGGTELQNDDYYLLTKAYPAAKYLQDDWLIFNSAILRTSYLRKLGGYDCQFKIACFGMADLAGRAQGNGSKVIFLKEKLCHCQHGQSDHRVIETNHVYSDAPLYQHIWDTQSYRIYIDINNWQKAPAVWDRFK